MPSLRDLLLAPEDDPLARELAPFFMGGWSPEVVMQGQIHPQDPRQTLEQRVGTISQQPPPVDLLARAMGGGAGLPWVAGYAMEAGADPETAHKLDALAGIVGQAMEAKAAKGTASASAVARTQAPGRIRPGYEKQFQEWFGSSKAINERGEPATVYHGTTNAFSSFKSGREQGASEALGYWFADSPRLSNMLLRLHGNVENVREILAGRRKPTPGRLFSPPPDEPGPVPEKSNIMSAHLSIKKPFVVESRDILESSVAQAVGRTRDEAQTIERGLGSEDMSIGQNAQAGLRRLGYDGIRILDDNGQGGVWVAFAPSQIKSATGNRGTYSRESADIRE